MPATQAKGGNGLFCQTWAIPAETERCRRRNSKIFANRRHIESCSAPWTLDPRLDESNYTIPQGAGASGGYLVAEGGEDPDTSEKPSLFERSSSAEWRREDKAGRFRDADKNGKSNSAW